MSLTTTTQRPVLTDVCLREISRLIADTATISLGTRHRYMQKIKELDQAQVRLNAAMSVVGTVDEACLADVPGYAQMREAAETPVDFASELTAAVAVAFNELRTLRTVTIHSTNLKPATAPRK